MWQETDSARAHERGLFWSSGNHEEGFNITAARDTLMRVTSSLWYMLAPGEGESIPARVTALLRAAATP